MLLRFLALCSFSACIAALMLHAPAPVSAGPNMDARILVHVTSPVSKNGCDLRSNPPWSYGIDTSGQLDTDYTVYVILCNLSSTAGVGFLQFGIAYDGAASSGVDVSSWTSCGTSLEYPWNGWPAAGTGVRLVWNSPECLPTVVDQFAMFVAGYFQLRADSPDEFSVIPHPQDQKASIWDCSGPLGEDVLMNSVVLPLGWAVFSAEGTTSGSNPCGYDAGSCHISGPDSVGTGQTGIQFVMKPEEVTPYGSWSIYGNAQIVSSNNSAATVNATSPGTFYIRYTRSDCVEGCGCQREVQVLGTVPVQPTTWGRIKTAFARD